MLMIFLLNVQLNKSWQPYVSHFLFSLLNFFLNNLMWSKVWDPPKSNNFSISLPSLGGLSIGVGCTRVWFVVFFKILPSNPQVVTLLTNGTVLTL